MFLYPHLKWRWFERHWETEPAWIAAAREAIAVMWNKHKYRTNNNNSTAVIKPIVVDGDDEWSGDDNALIAD